MQQDRRSLVAADLTLGLAANQQNEGLAGSLYGPMKIPFARANLLDVGRTAE